MKTGRRKFKNSEKFLPKCHVVCHIDYSGTDTAILQRETNDWCFDLRYLIFNLELGGSEILKNIVIKTLYEIFVFLRLTQFNWQKYRFVSYLRKLLKFGSLYQTIQYQCSKALNSTEHSLIIAEIARKQIQF